MKPVQIEPPKFRFLLKVSDWAVRKCSWGREAFWIPPSAMRSPWDWLWGFLANLFEDLAYLDGTWTAFGQKEDQ